MVIFFYIQGLVLQVKKNKKGSGLRLTSKEIKDVMKAIRILDNRRITLKGTTKRILRTMISQFS